jgi:hypothetical protein
VQTPRSVGAHAQACLRAPHRQAPTPDGESAALIRRAPYRLFRPLDSDHGLWPWALARDGVPREGKSSRGRPERSAAKSKGDEVGAPGSARGDPLPGPRACPPLEGPITGFMRTPYLPVRDRTCLRLPVAFATQTGATHRQAQTGTRRTSCHEPNNRNRDAAWRVISALFRSKRRLSVNFGLAPPCVHSRYTSPERRRPPQSACRQHDVPSLPLTHKARIPYTPAHWKQVLITSLSLHFKGMGKQNV